MAPPLPLQNLSKASKKRAKAPPTPPRPEMEVSTALLHNRLGLPLKLALAEMCERRPRDPLRYLAHWILRWRINAKLKLRQNRDKIEFLEVKELVDAQKRKVLERKQRKLVAALKKRAKKQMVREMLGDLADKAVSLAEGESFDDVLETVLRKAMDCVDAKWCRGLLEQLVNRAVTISLATALIRAQSRLQEVSGSETSSASEEDTDSVGSYDEESVD